MKKLAIIVGLIALSVLTLLFARCTISEPESATVNTNSTSPDAIIQDQLNNQMSVEQVFEQAELSKESLETMETAENSSMTAPVSELALPLDRAAERMTKKTFGTYVTPQNSPVSPERFSGYHTGVDFETFPEEGTADVAVYAICTGPLLTKQWISGYGGVVVQQCELEETVVTVLYGHVRLASVTATPDDTLHVNDRLGVLGTGGSSETDGERKHLHLSIHRGAKITWAGYVSNQTALGDWIDPKTVLDL